MWIYFWTKAIARFYVPKFLGEDLIFLLETRLVALILFVVLLATQSSPAYDLKVLSEAISFFLEIVHHRKTPCSFLFNFLSFFLEFCERCGHETAGDLF